MYTKDPHDWRFSLTKECSTFAVHVCDSSGGEFRVVPMVIGHKEPEIGRAYLEAYMPAIPCQIGIEYLYYYYDRTYPTGIYNKSEIFKVSVGNCSYQE
jgi:hypothetical protein